MEVDFYIKPWDNTMGDDTYELNTLSKQLVAYGLKK